MDPRDVTAAVAFLQAIPGAEDEGAAPTEPEADIGADVGAEEEDPSDESEREEKDATTDQREVPTPGGTEATDAELTEQHAGQDTEQLLGRLSVPALQALVDKGARAGAPPTPAGRTSPPTYDLETPPAVP